MELTWNGERPLRLADGSERSFLLDGDEVVITGVAPSSPDRCIGLGGITGRIVSRERP